MVLTGCAVELDPPIVIPDESGSQQKMSAIGSLLNVLTPTEVIIRFSGCFSVSMPMVAHFRRAMYTPLTATLSWFHFPFSCIAIGPLDIDGNNIAGILPFEVALLSDLDTIILSKQAIQGSIPEGWSSLTKLSTFIIGSNQLTGTFPDFLFFENSLLGTLYLSTNKLSGSLPATASSALLSLRVDQNSFTGPIPAAYGAFGTLRECLCDLGWRYIFPVF